ncbi:MAG: DUF3833 domain-containing protein [Pseudomonadota bacterium]
MTKRYTGVFVMALLSSLLSACSGIQGKQYQDASPQLTLEDYFNGPIKAWGIIQDYTGNITKRFDVTMEGRWEGNQGTLEETFQYYDEDQPQYRTWKIQKHSDTEYTGQAGDIIGTAQGHSYGNAIRWTYSMDVPVGDTHYRLHFDDWMWGLNDGIVINRSYLKKFGLTVAEITLFMQKQ